MFRDSGVPVSYWRCRDCGLLWTDAFDDWPLAEYRERIYDEDYVLADPPFVYERPARNAAMLERMAGDRRDRISVLDWGGGTGLLGRLLRDRGFSNVETYDLLYDSANPITGHRFDLVCCFEVVEHVPDQFGVFEILANHIADRGALLLSTLLQPPDIARIGLDWWYARPRNGHIRMHSRRSLGKLLNANGLTLLSLSDDLHLAFREPMPELAAAVAAAGAPRWSCPTPLERSA